MLKSNLGNNRWRRKHLLMYPFSHNRFGENLYEWLTAAALGTQKGMSRKWCYWFREHILLSRRHANISFSGKRIWLFEPGWSLAPVILSYLVTAKGPLVTEDYNRQAKRYISPALTEVHKAAPIVCKSAVVPATNLEFLNSIERITSTQQMLDTCQAQYLVGDPQDLKNIPSEAADICFSMGRLEHFKENDLRYLLQQMSRILSPHGIGTHIIDHRDHFWHYDKSIHCFHHLTFSDQAWSTLAKGRHIYRNRLLEPDYIRLFNEAGFEVLGCIHKLHRQDAKEVDPKSLWGPYAKLSFKDLEAAVSHFIVRRI